MMNVQASKLVAIAVFRLRYDGNLSSDEQISLRHLKEYLNRYPTYLIAPENSSDGLSNFETRYFPKKYFGSAIAHRRLLLSPEFYERFSGFKYLLIYHLDALVFSNQLEQWCLTDIDFVGAPHIKHEDAPYFGNTAWENTVGSGGFSLRKIESFLKVIKSRKRSVDPKDYWRKQFSHQPMHMQILNFPKIILKHLFYFNNAKWEMARYGNAEEHFWIHRAKYYYPGFAIPTIDTALRFAFECVPRYCYELTNHTLPFGAHAWERYDRSFYEPFLLKG